MNELFKLGKMIAKGSGGGHGGGSHSGGGGGYQDPYYNSGHAQPPPPGNYGQYNNYGPGPGYGDPYYNNQPMPPPPGAYGGGYAPYGNYGPPPVQQPYGHAPNYGYNDPHAGGYAGGHGGAYGGHASRGGPEMIILKGFDKDGDGRITENDFVISVRQLGLGSVGESTVRSVFRRLDKNHNGKLDFNEALGAIGTLKSLSGSGHKSHGGFGY